MYTYSDFRYDVYIHTQVVGIVDMLVPSGSTSAFSILRSLRILRPLRTLHHIPSLRMLTNTLLYSLYTLGPVCSLLVLLLSMFAIFAIVLWGEPGYSHGRCRLTKYPVALSAFVPLEFCDQPMHQQHCQYGANGNGQTVIQESHMHIYIPHMETHTYTHSLPNMIDMICCPFIFI